MSVFSLLPPPQSESQSALGHQLPGPARAGLHLGPRRLHLGWERQAWPQLWAVAEALPGSNRVLAAPLTVQFSEHLPSGQEGLPCLPLMWGLRAGAPGPPVGPDQRTRRAGGGWSTRWQEREPAGPGVGPCERPDTKQALIRRGRSQIPAEQGPSESHTWQQNPPTPPHDQAAFSETAQRGKTTYFFILKNHREEAVTVWGRSRGPILPRAPNPSTGSLCLSLVPLLPPRPFWTPQSFVQASTPVGSRAVGDDTHLRVCLAVEAAASLGGAGLDAPLARAQPNQCADYCTHSEPPEQVV